MRSLYGQIYNHPSLDDGDWATTSALLPNQDLVVGNIVESRNTRYELGKEAGQQTNVPSLLERVEKLETQMKRLQKS